MVALHALETLDAIVKTGDGGGDGEVGEGGDARLAPAGLLSPVDLEHVVAELLAELEGIRVGLDLGGSVEGDGEV